MNRRRNWAVRNAGGLSRVYHGLEAALLKLYPIFEKAGLERVEKVLYAIEAPAKKLMFDSQGCGQCTLGATGMACPMNCPKTIRNGPCGGVRANGKCEVKPEMDCVWVLAYQGTQHLPAETQALHIVQPPLDARRKGRSAWLREAEQKFNELRGAS